MTDLPALDLLDVGGADEIGPTLPHWGLSSTQLEPGAQESFHHQVTFDDLVVLHFRESCSIAYDYRPPPDTTTFCLFTPKSARQRWCGVEIPQEVLLIHPGGRDYISWYPAGFDSIGLIASNALLDELEILPAKLLQRREISRQWMIPITEEGRAFARWLYGVFGSANELKVISRDPVTATLFREKTFDGLVTLLGSSARPGGPPIVTSTFGRYGLTRRALDLIDAQLTQGLSTSRLACQLGVSPRVLQLAFRDVLETSPYDYVLKRKLHAARSDLLGPAACDRTVTAAALRYGFSELGRFSQRYRRMFGELPSETARQSGRQP